MPTILLISYYYPPINVTGAQRPLSLARYLPEHGYRIRVLTTRRHGRVPGEDRSLVHRAGEPYGFLVKPVRDFVYRRVSALERATARVLSNESLLARLQNYLLVPDQAVTWVPFAVRLGMAMHMETPFAGIISTSPPESAHLVACALKRRLGIPWIADFRDGWTFEPLKPRECYRGWQGRLRLSLEEKVVSAADRIVSVTPAISHDFGSRYPEAAGRVRTIMNGYDEAEFEEIRPLRTGSAFFQMTYTGALSLSRPDRLASPFYLALARLVAENAGGIRERLRVSFVGDFTDREKEEIGRLGLQPWVEFRKPVPRPVALRMQCEADVLLLITEKGTKGVATAKLFDYIGARKPVLALAKGDTAGEIVEKYGIGRAVDRESVDDISAAIGDLYCAWLSGTLRLEGPPPVECSRRHQAGQMAGLLRACGAR